MMTLSQVERLVRKIDELLSQPALEAQAAKLAQEYSELGRAANRRLEQCAAMIESGDDLQALQLAETPPALLNLITLLSFRQAKEWRAYCQGRNLPWVEPFYDKHVRALNSTYGKGIASDHPFYRDYRRAVMKGEDGLALSILQVIARLNPTDKNTSQELQRLEEKAVQAKLGELRQALEQGDTISALAQLEQIEVSSLAIPSRHPVWQQAQLLRCQQLIRQAQTLHERDAWEDAELVVEEIKALANQNDVPLTPADTEAWNALERWTSGCRYAVVQDQEFQHSLDALRYQVETCETNQATAGNLTSEQLRSDLNHLANKLQDAERFGRPLDADLINRYDHICAGLQGRIQKQLKRQRVKVVMGTLFGLALLAASGIAFWSFTQGKQIGSKFQKLESERRVGETELLLKHIPTLIPPPLKLGTGLSDAMAKAGQFVAREQKLKQEFDEKLGTLKTFAGHGFSNASDQVTGARAECAQALERLAPEFKTTGEIDLSAVEQLWQSHLAGLQPMHNADFRSRLERAEKLASERLNLTNGFAAFRGALPQVQSLLMELEGLQSKPVPLETGLPLRFRNLTNAVSLLSEAAEHLPKSHTLEEYLNGLNQMSQSSLVTSAQREMLSKVRGLKLKPFELLGALLLPGQAWGSLESSLAVRPAFMPKEPTSEEVAAYKVLLDDRNIQEVYDYYLDKRPRPENPAQAHHILTRGKLTQDKFGGPAGMVYDPIKFPDNLRFEQQSIDTWNYTNIANRGLTKEAGAFHAMGLGDLIDTTTGNYQKAILQLLDQLSQDTDTSAMFRAYLSVKLFALAELRPTEWGLEWSPSAPIHIQSLKDLGAQSLRSGDWMVRSQYDIYEKPLEKYFEKARANSLEKQARFLQLLSHQACQAGFAFAGFIDGNGNPVLSQTNSIEGEYWGWSIRSDSPGLLLRQINGSGDWEKLDAPLPFTPLFVFQEDRRRILERVSKGTLYPIHRADALLPPLFSATHE